MLWRWYTCAFLFTCHPSVLLQYILTLNSRGNSGWPGTVCCFDTATHSRILKFAEPSRKSFYCCASNGQLIAAGGEAGISFWDIRSQKLLGCFEEFHTQDVLQVTHIAIILIIFFGRGGFVFWGWVYIYLFFSNLNIGQIFVGSFVSVALSPVQPIAIIFRGRRRHLGRI